MSKPILVLKFPSSYDNVAAEAIGKSLQDTTVHTDYHTFLLRNNEDDFDFKVFNGEFTQEEFDTLSKLIEDLKKDSNDKT